MMELDRINNVYFIGIGGIGMSALARFFVNSGKKVSGYDRTASNLTTSLESEGMHIHYDDNTALIPDDYLSENEKEQTLIVYTPAIPAEHKEMAFFRGAGYTIMKRAQVLGMISRNYSTIAIAGSHGKSTLSAMVATIFNESPAGCSAFLGAISKNFNSNLVLSSDSHVAVMEADEFDRSFLHLEPEMALVTSMDPDHLDIYGGRSQLKESFKAFLGKLKAHSTAIIKDRLDLVPPKEKQLKIISYGMASSAGYFASNLMPVGLGYQFDLHTPTSVIEGMLLQIPGWINIENAVGAAAICLESGLDKKQVALGLARFKGVKRRFDVRFNQKDKVYIDDYAHHPKEIRALCQSIRKLFPGRKVVGVFQPHLFNRTRDFADDFARELSALDELALMPIYPAREEAIPGIDSTIILDGVSTVNKGIMASEQIIEYAGRADWDVFLTIGAGDIDRLVKPIENILNEMV
ncbi:MAG: UDP-N-acetylmuramate--L-alanine ligase [Bacteroidales bacterium]|nr:UDP-N-acetylmuramate--L-alanine ligase [Bacteroidales bacterium]